MGHFVSLTWDKTSRSNCSDSYCMCSWRKFTVGLSIVAVSGILFMSLILPALLVKHLLQGKTYSSWFWFTLLFSHQLLLTLGPVRILACINYHAITIKVILQLQVKSISNGTCGKVFNRFLNGEWNLIALTITLWLNFILILISSQQCF